MGPGEAPLGARPARARSAGARSGTHRPAAGRRPADRAWRPGPRSCCSSCERNGYREETLLHLLLQPDPRRRRHERRRHVLRRHRGHRARHRRAAAAHAARAAPPTSRPRRRAEDACARPPASLRDNRADLPFALLYLLDDDARRAALRRRRASSGRPRRAPAPIALGDGRRRRGRSAGAADGPRRAAEVRARLRRRLPAGAWPEAPTRRSSLPIAPRPDGGSRGVAGRRRQPAPRVRRRVRGFLRARRAGRSRPAIAQRARRTRTSGGAPRRWPSSTARRPRSSPTSATSSGRR